MPYDFNWHDTDHTIIRVDIHGKVTWEAWYGVMDEVRQAIETSTWRVDLILNDSVGMPPGNPMPHLKSTTARLNRLPHMGIIVTVSPPNLSIITRTIISVMIRVAGNNNVVTGIFVNKLDEALAAIAKDRIQKPVTV